MLCCFLLLDRGAFAAQAVLLARIQAIMAGDKELANRMFMPAKMQAQAVKQALSLTSHVCSMSQSSHTGGAMFACSQWGSSDIMTLISRVVYT